MQFSYEVYYEHRENGDVHDFDVISQHLLLEQAVKAAQQYFDDNWQTMFGKLYIRAVPASINLGCFGHGEEKELNTIKVRSDIIRKANLNYSIAEWNEPELTKTNRG
jgi:hypothetical protein